MAYFRLRPDIGEQSSKESILGALQESEKELELMESKVKVIIGKLSVVEVGYQKLREKYNESLREIRELKVENSRLKKNKK